jgi:hypothetical protein
MKTRTTITIHEFPERDGAPYPNAAIVIQQDFEKEEGDTTPSEPLDPQIISMAIDEDMAFQALCEVSGLRPDSLAKANGLYYQTELNGPYDGSNIILAISNNDGGFIGIAEFTQFAMYMTPKEIETVFDFMGKIWE